MFIPVEGLKVDKDTGKPYYQLNDFTAVGMTDWGDSIQFLVPDSAEPYLFAVYLSAEDGWDEGMVGWWDALGDFTSEEYKLGETAVPAGQGFLAAFTGGGEITVTFPAAY